MKRISKSKKLGMAILIAALAATAMFTNIEITGPKPANADPPTTCPPLTPEIPSGSICVNGKWVTGGPTVAQAGPEKPPVATDAPPLEDGEPECKADTDCKDGKKCVTGSCQLVTPAAPPAPPKTEAPKAEDKPAPKKAGESCKDDTECSGEMICDDKKCAAAEKKCVPACDNKKCGDDGCGGECLCGEEGEECNKGKCEKPAPPAPPEVDDPCELVEFSDGDDRGCVIAAAAYFHGYEAGQVRQYLKTKVLKGGSAKSKAKRLATFNAGLLREVREGLWRGASHLYGLKTLKAMTPEELKTALATKATLLEELRDAKRMDSRIGAVHNRIERECGAQPCSPPDGDVN